ncbi:MAG: hypothetical protein ACK5MA_00380 [Parachlamydiaceae bacterium]
MYGIPGSQPRQFYDNSLQPQAQPDHIIDVAERLEAAAVLMNLSPTPTQNSVLAQNRTVQLPSPKEAPTKSQEIPTVAKTVLPPVYVDASSMIKIAVPLSNSSLQVSWVDGKGNRQISNWCIDCKQEIISSLTEQFIKIPCFYTHDYDGSYSNVSILFKGVFKNDDYEIPIFPVSNSQAEQSVKEQAPLPLRQNFFPFLPPPADAKEAPPAQIITQPREITNKADPEKGKRLVEEAPEAKRQKTQAKKILLELGIQTAVGNAINLNLEPIESTFAVEWTDKEGKHELSNWCSKCNHNIVVLSKDIEKVRNMTHAVFNCNPTHVMGRPTLLPSSEILHFQDQNKTQYQVPIKIFARRFKTKSTDNWCNLTAENAKKYSLPRAITSEANPEKGEPQNQISGTIGNIERPKNGKRLGDEAPTAKRQKRTAENIPLELGIQASVGIAINLNLEPNESTFALEWTDKSGVKHGPINKCSECKRDIVVLSTNKRKEKTHIKFNCTTSHTRGQSTLLQSIKVLHFQDRNKIQYQVPIRIIPKQFITNPTDNWCNLTAENAKKYTVTQ